MRLLLVVVLGLITLTACTSESQRRIDDLEDRVTALEETPPSGGFVLVSAPSLGDCRGNTDATYMVAWVIDGLHAWLCVKPDSQCAREAYPGGPIPRTCRDQGE